MIFGLDISKVRKLYQISMTSGQSRANEIKSAVVL